MTFRLPIRRLIALAAAYLIAGQSFLLPLSVAAASPLLASLCVSSADGAGLGHGGSGDGCGCAAGCGVLCCAPAALNTPPAEFRVPPTVVRLLAPVTAFSAGIPADSPGSHQPRAPPAS